MSDLKWSGHPTVPTWNCAAGRVWLHAASYGTMVEATVAPPYEYPIDRRQFRGKDENALVQQAKAWAEGRAAFYNETGLG